MVLWNPYNVALDSADYEFGFPIDKKEKIEVTLKDNTGKTWRTKTAKYNGDNVPNTSYAQSEREDGDNQRIETARIMGFHLFAFGPAQKMQGNRWQPEVLLHMDNVELAPGEIAHFGLGAGSPFPAGVQMDNAKPPENPFGWGAEAASTNTGFIVKLVKGAYIPDRNIFFDFDHAPPGRQYLGFEFSANFGHAQRR